ncbi:L-threonylcarbamoyladenylate synthase [Rickettsiaceae bacterium]|nr:L-threonylcarbamoyladenylate synthase [Rickettsiaceae bacterium]
MNEINKAAKIIQDGGLVAFPTETVYGLGADACNQEACLNIFKAKGRASNNPLIVHVESFQDAAILAEFNDDAIKLTQFWPGPLTLVLPKKENSEIASIVTSNLNTIAIRVPSNKIALELIKKSKTPIAAPSANKSGKLSPTNYEHVKKNFGDDVFILKSEDNTDYGLESTIIDLTTSIPTILRYGFITPSAIESVLGKKVQIAHKGSKVKAPGMLHNHYAPKTHLRISARSLNDNEIGLNFGNSKLNSPFTLNLNLSKKGDLAEAAANLFNHLHMLDEFAVKNNINTIAVAPIPNESIGLAINDRLKRGAGIY